MLTHGIRPAFRGNGVHLYRQQPSCILEGQSRVYRVTTQLHHRGSVPSLSSHRPIAYRWSSPPRVRRRRVSNPRRSSSNGMLHFHVSKMGHFLCVSFFRRSWTRVTVYRKYQIYVTVSIALSATEELLVCVCVCVFFPFILDIKIVGRNSRGHTGFLVHLLSAVRAFIFLARRIQPFISLVDREVEFCVLTI